MVALHIPTLLVVLELLFFLMTCVLGTMWRSRGRDPAVGTFALGFGAMFVGGFIAVFYQTLPTWSWAVGSCGLILAGQALIWSGLRRFDGLTTHLTKLLVVPAVYVIVIIPSGIWEHQAPRAALFGVLFSFLCFGCAYQLFAGRTLEPLPSRKPLALAFAALGAIYAVRFAVAFVGAGSLEWIALVFLVQIFNALAFAVGLFALIKERAEQALTKAADTDQLTGIANRRSFFRLANAPLRGALVVIDLDHFKQINDNFGHAIGDDVLVGCARAIVPELRPQDVFARVGGEEFVVFLPETDEEHALVFAERIRSVVLSLSVYANGTTVNLTTSIGVAVSGNEPSPLNSLLGLADAALYRAKDLGRNRVQAASAMNMAFAAPSMMTRAA